jgi:DNA-binding Lrp family transcriptional regulator
MISRAVFKHSALFFPVSAKYVKLIKTFAEHLLMDETDRKIVEELRRDCRQPNSGIAKKLKVSEGTIRNRIARLLKEGVIKRFTIDIGTSSGFMAFVTLECDPGRPTAQIVSAITGIGDVRKVYETAGRWDVVALIDTESPEKFNEVIEKVRSVEGIVNTETLTVLKIN